MLKLEKILQYLASIVGVFKPNEAILNERAEKKDIRNKRLQKKVELRNLRTQKKINRIKKNNS